MNNSNGWVDAGTGLVNVAFAVVGVVMMLIAITAPLVWWLL